MKLRSLLLLFAVALGLGAFIWFVEKDVPSTEDRLVAEKRLFGTLEAEDVRGVRLEQEGQGVTLVRTDTPEADSSAMGTWRIAAPLDARADAGAVDGLVRRLIGLEIKRKLEGAVRADFGLTEPSRRIVVTKASGEEVVLEIGDPAPVGDGVVVAFGGDDTLRLVDATVAADLDKPAGDWRNRQLVSALRNEIAGVRIAPEGVLLSKRAENFWLETPVIDRADEDHVNSLFSTLSGARIERFVDEPSVLSDLGLEPPAGSLELILEGSETPTRIDWGAPTGPDGGRFWVRVDGQVVEATGAVQDIVQRPANEWRSRTWTTTRSFEVQRVSVASATANFEVVRAENDSDWNRGDDSIGYAAVSDLLYALSSGRAAEVADPGAIVFTGTPTIAITLATKGDEKIEGLQLHRVGEVWWSPAPGREALLRFDPAWIADLEAKIAAVATAQPETVEMTPDPEGSASEDEL